MDLTPQITDYIHEKLSVVEKYINPEMDEEILAEIEVGIISKHHKKGDVYMAEINLTSKGKQYRAVSKTGDLYASIDNLKDQISKSLRRSKDKKGTLFIRGARKIKSLLKRKK